ncbi:MAG: bacillithiol biosynthesis BshC, partial [Bacteroidetes bacterium]
MQLIAKIPLQEVVSNKLIRAYLEKNPLLNPLVDYFPDKQAFKSVMENKSKFFRHRENLVEALLEQNKNAGAKVLENIRLLKENNTYTVTTGHQLCVLGGPAYFFHKIIHTVKLVQELAHHFPENNFVPVFWMASEDHDFEEISKLYVYGKEIKWQREANNEPVGQLSLEKIDEVFNELNEIFQNDAHALNIIKELREAYAKGQNLSESTRNFVKYYKEKYGVVI